MLVAIFVRISRGKWWIPYIRGPITKKDVFVMTTPNFVGGGGSLRMLQLHPEFIIPPPPPPQKDLSVSTFNYVKRSCTSISDLSMAREYKAKKAITVQTFLNVNAIPKLIHSARKILVIECSVDKLFCSSVSQGFAFYETSDSPGSWGRRRQGYCNCTRTKFPMLFT